MSRELRIGERVKFNSINEFIAQEEELTGKVIGDYKAVKKQYPEECGEVKEGFYLVKVAERPGNFIIHQDEVLEVLEPEEKIEEDEILPDDYDEEQEDDEAFEEHERQVFRDAGLDKPELRLIGEDGNAFFVIGKALREAKRAGWSVEKIEAFKKEAMSGDYDHVLQTCMEHFEVV